MSKKLVGRLCCLMLGLVLTVLSCVSCSCGPSWEGEEGYTLTVEMMEEISREIFGTQPPSEEELSLTPEELAKTAYWLEGGTVYHLLGDCSHIRNKADVQTGTVADALTAGKKKLCSSCNKRLHVTETEADAETEMPPDTYGETVTDAEETDTPSYNETHTEEQTGSHTDAEITVYWVKNGSVYHMSLDCSSLKRSTDIQSGTVEESGKPRACSRCG